MKLKLKLCVFSTLQFFTGLVWASACPEMPKTEIATQVAHDAKVAAGKVGKVTVAQAEYKYDKTVESVLTKYKNKDETHLRIVVLSFLCTSLEKDKVVTEEQKRKEFDFYATKYLELKTDKSKSPVKEAYVNLKNDKPTKLATPSKPLAVEKTAQQKIRTASTVAWEEPVKVLPSPTASVQLEKAAIVAAPKIETPAAKPVTTSYATGSLNNSNNEFVWYNKAAEVQEKFKIKIQNNSCALNLFNELAGNQGYTKEINTVCIINAGEPHDKKADYMFSYQGDSPMTVANLKLSYLQGAGIKLRPDGLVIETFCDASTVEIGVRAGIQGGFFYMLPRKLSLDNLAFIEKQCDVK